MCQCKQFGSYVEIWYDEAPSFDAGFTTIAKGRYEARTEAVRSVRNVLAG